MLFLFWAMPVGAMVFEPEKCPEPDPEGKAYLSLGETVLRIPLRTLSITHKPRQDWPLPTPPDASQPLGCSGNPLAQQSLIINFSFSAWLRDRKQPSTSPLREIRLIWARRDFYGRFQSDSYDPSCDRLTRHMALANGLLGCLPDKNPERPDRDQVGTYRAAPHIYAMPFGQTFIMECWPDIPRGAVCKVGYKVLPTVNLVYRFTPERIPLEEVIEIDKMLRKQIEQAVVTDYKWQDDKADQEDQK
ncbi:hypothetical protein SAMN05216600_11911 [Pseudomonas cuatrocienegasensis]|uniref:Uncharacterized protein n=1 Tax=Pseudomonas cuatrocienegasensis TaxID=543360 RepID=A0ABY1BNE6_9PSED|nr:MULTISPECIES: hypothetical protein [Pseudomonas]OEC33665.1 hypothetical protein A7D25_17490 [Pseudomonas sp. 21C1]SER24530.1 hypothetical protein SAMN05216600_11911 [Pseudomonas cuatrocienegasensis]